MKIKKYVARSMPEAMNQIKKELGKDAVILNSKEVKTGGIFGLFKKKNIEVIAALDQSSIPREKTKRKLKPNLNRTPKPSNHEPKDREVLEELKHLKELIATQAFQSEHQFQPEFEHLYQFLLKQEVNEQLAQKMVESIQLKNKDQQLSFDEIKALLKDEIIAQLEGLSFDGIDFNHQQVIQFVGPTGVGKTTTLAKVAAHSILKYKKKIAFITADTYRIAAIEQLKTYARILDVPIEVAYTIEDYQKALQKFKDYDLIFVDTAGRNFRDERYLQELKKVIAFEQFKVATYLVLALTAKAQDIIDIYEQFEQIPLQKVIFTKVDETITYGSILNICVDKQIAVAHFTNGQDVPDDIVKADPDYISNLITRRYQNV